MRAGTIDPSMRVRARKVQMGRGTKIMSNNRVTIPVAELRKAGLRAGDLVVIRPAGAGRITIVRAG